MITRIQRFLVVASLLLSCQALGFAVERRRSVQKNSSPDDSTSRRRNSNKAPSSKPRGSSPSPSYQRNKNRKKRSGYELRKRGISTRRTKPPKWEQEGSRLYDEILVAPGDKGLTIDEAKDLLAQHHQLKANTTRSTSEIASQPSSEASRPDLPFLWGPLSVGPVWKQKLETTLGYRHPTPIQCQAYPKIASTKNVTNLLIAAPTGSGKSLAYLLPLLTTQPKQVAILVPTVELCSQIQQVILQLAPQQPTTVLEEGDNDLPLLDNKDKKKGSFVISTPSAFAKYLRRQRRSMSLLDVLVLDEADALMEMKDTVRIVSRLSNTRMIAASASVGRSLRRQLKEALQAPSLEKAFALITADDRTKKHESIRKASLLPKTIRHEYHLHLRNDNNSEDEIQTTILTMLNETSSEFQNAIVFVRDEEQARQMAERLSEHNPELQIETSVSNVKSTPTIYILPQNLGRGLDLPNVDVVILPQLPSTAADYLHLSGRTGRSGQSGTVISILTPKQAPILCQMATLLQLPLHPC